MPTREYPTEVLVVGGGLGGVAAALAAARSGRDVILTEETDWLGGQLTQQGVPPDEHPWIEQFGCTASYRALRDGIRDHYRRWYPLTEEARADRRLNPGGGRVSSLCHEPTVAVAVLEALLAPHRGARRLRVWPRHTPASAAVTGDTVEAVTLRDLDNGGDTVVTAPYVLDATETGELLPLTGAEYVTGAEAHADTGEPHAPPTAQPLNMQAVSHCFAMDHRAGEDHTIDRPADYDRWRQATLPGWPGRAFAWFAPNPKTGAPVRHRLEPNPDRPPVAVDLTAEGGSEELWTFRRIAARTTFRPGAYPSDITLVNWPMIDYVDGPVFEVGDAAAARHRAGARALSRAFLYWLQTEAPRPDGGVGYPGLRLRGDVLGTADGLAKRAYIRESRRIRARRTVVEQDVATAVRGHATPATVPDGVGVGAYRIDLHPTTGGDAYLDIGACPFEIPLGALLPVRLRNLLPAAKNLGTTHLTNGCFRLHPTEWNVGEVAGSLAAYCLDTGAQPVQVREDEAHLDAFRTRLGADGVELGWPRVEGY